MQKVIWFTGGLVIGLTALSITRASVPTRGRVTDDTALYQQLSEIHVKKEAKIDFDSDITRLSQMEEQYKEKLPSARHPRLKGPMERVAQQKYSYSGQKSSKNILAKRGNSRKRNSSVE